MNIDKINGSCLCKQIAFTLILPVQWVAHCHCSMCRKAQGAPFVTWVGVLKKNFVLNLYKSLTDYHSSPDAQRSFCSICGSPLFFQSKRWPEEIHITRASLPDNTNLQPTAHCFYSDKAPWIDIHDSLPKKGGISGIEPL
ncbi:MAG: GFA family protein [Alphaproteobacteria bacterium]|nr:GFA family protein [Alphaproteobacteria bacterium]